MNKINNHTLKTYIEPKTGYIIKQDEYLRRSIPQKENGFNLVYCDNLRDLCSILTNSRDLALFIDLMLNEVDKEFILRLDYKKLMEVYGLTRSKAQRFISTLTKHSIIKGSRGVYKVSPFYILPKYIDDEIVANKQREWLNG